MTTSPSQLKLLQAMARGLDPDEGVLGFEYAGHMYVYETEEETLLQFNRASWDVPVTLKRFINNEWKVTTHNGTVLR